MPPYYIAEPPCRYAARTFGASGLPAFSPTHRPGEVRFVVLTRPRSASTTFIQLLGRHPDVSAAFEVYNFGHPSTLHASLGFGPTESPGVPDFSGRFFACCPTPVCGFKMMDGHVRPTIIGAWLGDHTGVPYSAYEPQQPTAAQLAAHGVRLLVLERRNVTAEYHSLSRAKKLGDWGTTPEDHARFAANGVPSGSIDPTHVSASEFAAQHRLFSNESSAALPSRPHRHIWSEALMGSHEHCNATMAGVFDFLGVAPMRDNCGGVSPHGEVVAGAAVRSVHRPASPRQTLRTNRHSHISHPNS